MIIAVFLINRYDALTTSLFYFSPLTISQSECDGMKVTAWELDLSLLSLLQLSGIPSYLAIKQPLSVVESLLPPPAIQFYTQTICLKAYFEGRSNQTETFQVIT